MSYLVPSLSVRGETSILGYSSLVSISISLPKLSERNIPERPGWQVAAVRWRVQRLSYDRRDRRASTFVCLFRDGMAGGKLINECVESQ